MNIALGEGGGGHLVKKCDYFLKMLLLYLFVPTNLSTIVGAIKLQYEVSEGSE